MARGQARRNWIARMLAVLALLILAAGSVLVGSLWLTPQDGPLYVTITYQAQHDAAAYGVGLFWPLTIGGACVVGSLALACAHVRKRVIAALYASGSAVIIGAYALAFGAGIESSTSLPLRGAGATVLIVLLLVINGSAILGAWWYVMRWPPKSGTQA